ncbi:hypothetical protein LO80_09515 [Candidatus Francisella endociliophora]|uniref:chitinase n=1 Tax=Candidatus Francisella endociliophora TaxID=653937 RepID=A0A097ERL8_9GAMM|nr:glycosyl hydrolase family 18 protein [Francisella sp. FSC1006]AIT10187.1 hypothetical protein LO80_09515 [Francisella sp. FSC1006]
MNRKIKMLSFVTLALMGSTAFADCTLDEAKDGWTGSLRFQCDENTDLLKNPISFELTNGVQAGSIWGLPGKTSVIKNGNKVSVTVEKWWPEGEGYVLPAGQSTVLSFSPTNVVTYDANYAPDFEVKNFSVGEGEVQEKATVAIKLPEKPSFITDQSLPDVVIYNSSDVKISEITDAAWGSAINAEVPAGDIKIVVPAINGANGTASPTAFSIAKGETKNIQINYEQPAPAEEGSIELSARIDADTTKKPTYTVKDSNGKIITQGMLNFSNPVTINNLPATDGGTKYTISVGEFSENGTIYKAEPITVTVTKFNTSKANLVFEKQAIPTQDVNVKVNGLPDQQTATLTLTSSNGDKQELTLDKNDNYSISIPKDDATWTVTTTSISGYRVTTSPSSFTANQDSQNISVAFEQQAPIEAGKKVVGYWANWKGALQAPAGTSNTQSNYYTNDVAPYTHVLYSFLTLDPNPNPDSPADKEWNGTAVYESMTRHNVLDVMKQYPDGTPAYQRTDNWMRSRIDALIDSTHKNNSKFIWALGGWSDLQQTISPAQVDELVNQLVDLLKVSGDGIDFDWEHINQLANGQPNPNAKEEQAVLAETMLKLRQKLDAEGMQDKQIGYTTRFNAFMADSSKYGFPGFNSDGEGLAIDDWLRAHGSSLNKVVNWVNIMAYDVGPSYMPNGQTWNMNVYKDVLNTFSSRVDPNLVILGFEPGYQAAGGVWEGMEVSKQAINYLAGENYGGSMFWAINLENPASDGSKLGLNSDILADYSRDKFDLE